MSLVKVAGNASGTGTITIQAPNTNTNYTLDLPAAAGTIQLSGNAISGTTGTFSGTISGGSTIGVGGATPSASGAGITFPATQSASSDANTLDDYEEGTFTPTISFGGSSSGVAYSVQAGSYTKIGQVVYFTLRIALTSNGSGTGQATIGSLPFTSNAGSTGVRYQCKVFPLVFSGVTGEVTAQAGSGTATLDLYYGSSAYASITETNYPDAGDCIVTGFYIV